MNVDSGVSIGSQEGKVYVEGICTQGIRKFHDEYVRPLEVKVADAIGRLVGVEGKVDKSEKDINTVSEDHELTKVSSKGTLRENRPSPQEE